jgi:hypothetical protein
MTDDFEDVTHRRDTANRGAAKKPPGWGGFF